MGNIKKAMTENKPDKEDVGRRILLRVQVIAESTKSEWNGDWELFGIRWDNYLVIRNLKTKKIIELEYDRRIMRVVGPHLNTA